MFTKKQENASDKRSTHIVIIKHNSNSDKLQAARIRLLLLYGFPNQGASAVRGWSWNETFTNIKEKASRSIYFRILTFGFIYRRDESRLVIGFLSFCRYWYF